VTAQIIILADRRPTRPDPAAGYEDFARAMARKLVRETGTPEIGMAAP